MTDVRLGCAGWSLPRAVQERFAGDGSHLARYAAVFAATEINSSFRQMHRRSTYERWAATVPKHFRFSVKLPRSITHDAKLAPPRMLVEAFIDDVQGLGAHLGCLLVQTPPKLAFDAAVADAFFGTLRECHDGPVAAEPRHASWFTADADALLRAFGVSRVAADPALHAGDVPGGDTRLSYFRWHGSPRVYYSSYEPARLDDLAERLHRACGASTAVWCIFDNTTLGAAFTNALELAERLHRVT